MQGKDPAITDSEHSEVYVYQHVTTKEHYLNIKYIAGLAIFVIVAWVFLSQTLNWILMVFIAFIFIQIIWWKRLKEEQRLKNLYVSEQGIREGKERKDVYLWSDLSTVIHERPIKDNDYKPGFLLKFSNGKEIYVQQRISGYVNLYKRLRKLGVPGTENELKLYYPMDQYGRALSPLPKIEIAVSLKAQEREGKTQKSRD